MSTKQATPAQAHKIAKLQFANAFINLDSGQTPAEFLADVASGDFAHIRATVAWCNGSDTIAEAAEVNLTISVFRRLVDTYTESLAV